MLSVELIADMDIPNYLKSIFENESTRGYIQYYSLSLKIHFICSRVLYNVSYHMWRLFVSAGNESSPD